MSMISTVNEAINRKLASVSFTDIIIGTVISLEPLQIRINNRIVIGLSFIEPMSLGLDDNSPSSALPLTVGEKVQMIRYSNGQRFYILGKSTNASTIDYLQLQNKPKLNTANSNSLAVNSAEELNGTVLLHKVAKTGNYNDLSGLPSINNRELKDNLSLDDLGIKQDYNAGDIEFSDGETLQDKYNNSTLCNTAIYNGLDSTSTTDALSANMGRVLNDKFKNNMGNIIVESISSKNLFNKNDVVLDYYLSYDNGQPVHDTNMCYTNYYIEVNPGDVYTMSNTSPTIFTIHYYDANKNWLGYNNQNISLHFI